MELSDLGARPPDVNARRPETNAPLLPLGAFDMPLWSMPPLDDNFGFDLDWMTAQGFMDPPPRDEDGGDALLNGPHDDEPPASPPRINPPPRNDESEDDGEEEGEKQANPATSPRGKQAEAATRRTRASGPATPALPAEKQARPQPKPMYGLRRRAEAAAASHAPRNEDEPPRTIEKETPAPVEQDESADEGAESKDGGGEDRGGEEEPEGEVWQEETSQWPEELRNAFAAFARGKSWGGKHWERCVTQFIALERVWGFPSKGLLAALNSAGDRPKEIPDFMQSGRKWKSPVELQSMCGPARLEDSFGCRWWEWWGTAQPASRRKANGEFGPPHDVAASEWEEIGKMAGRNGLLLFLGGLLWWGEAAAAADDSEGLLDDWRDAVEDVAAVITEALKEAGPEPDPEKPQRKRAKAKEPSVAAPTTQSAKRKRPETRSATNKENKVPPR
ncbi:hypothetical protein B0H13DRAFT_2319009 [Mycena leptocephala]|nr:hypothetical protein B0H13DRAFT_2319009 [Mycena leptocephala]